MFAREFGGRMSFASFLLVGALAVSAGCSSGGGKTDATGTPVALPTLAATPLGVVAQRTADAKLYHPELKPRIAPDSSFRISLPADWLYEPRGGKPSPSVAASVSDTEGSPLATITVQCFPGVDGLHVLDNDATGFKGTMLGDLRSGARRQVPFLDGTADEVIWVGTSFGGQTPIQHRALYFTAAGCGWRLQLSTFPGADLSAFDDMWGEILASFQPSA